MSRDEDRHLEPCAEAGDHVEELGPDTRVEAHGRLVEKEHAGSRDQRPRDLEPSPLAAAIARNGSLEQLVDADRPCDLVDPRPDLGGRDAPQARVDLEVAAPGQASVHDRILEDDAAHGPRGERRGDDVEACEGRCSGRRPDRRRQHSNRRRLPGAVRAEEAEDLTAGDLEVDSLHGDGVDVVGIRLPEALNCNRR